jgi:hypothetical protein
VRKEHYLAGGVLLGISACLLRERYRIMASRDLLDRLRKANDTVKKLAGQITEMKQGDQEAANLADDIYNTANTAVQDSGGGGSTGGGSGAQTPPPPNVGPGQQGMTASQATAAVSNQQRPGAQQGR